VSPTTGKSDDDLFMGTNSHELPVGAGVWDRCSVIHYESQRAGRHVCVHV